jgi:hypothetical protein
VSAVRDRPHPSPRRRGAGSTQAGRPQETQEASETMTILFTIWLTGIAIFAWGHWYADKQYDNTDEILFAVTISLCWPLFVVVAVVEEIKERSNKDEHGSQDS